MKRVYVHCPGPVSLREFQERIQPALDRAIVEGARFVLSDRPGGGDRLAQLYLRQHRDRVTIYHTGPRPAFNLGGYPCVGGWRADQLHAALCWASTDQLIESEAVAA